MIVPVNAHIDEAQHVAQKHGQQRFECFEVNAVRQVARQLADIGRNVNQIARKVNIDPDRADLSSFDSDGYTLNWSTADATAREFVALAVGSTAAPPATTGHLMLLLGTG